MTTGIRLFCTERRLLWLARPDNWYKTNEAWEVAEVQAEVQEPIQTGPSTALNSPQDPIATDTPLSN